jgi:glycosyltransferase involved in cell wall biosynthesis
MHIRHILPQPAMGMLPADPLNAAITGVVNCAWNLALRQVEAGHRVEVLAPSNEPHTRRETFAGIEVVRLPQWSSFRTARYDYSNVLPLWSHALRAAAADVTHVHSNPFFSVSSKTRCTILHYNNLPASGSPRYDRAVGRAHRVFCCSDYIRREFLAGVRYPAEQVDVVHNGVSFSSYSGLDRGSARRALGIGADALVALFVGRFSEEKGLYVLLEAMAHLRASGQPEPLLLVAGSGTLGFEGHKAAWDSHIAHERQIHARAAELPVRFLGNVGQTELPHVYAAADVFVCPSTYAEPLGMVNVEAAAAGLPVVATATGGIPEIVLEGKTGLLVSPNDAHALADALARLLKNAALRDIFGQAALAVAKQHDWGRINEQVLLLYAKALGARAGTQQPVAWVEG